MNLECRRFRPAHRVIAQKTGDNSVTRPPPNPSRQNTFLFLNQSVKNGALGQVGRPGQRCCPKFRAMSRTEGPLTLLDSQTMKYGDLLESSRLALLLLINEMISSVPREKPLPTSRILRLPS